MKKPVFTGAAVAIITPFKSTGEVDYEEFGKIIDHQIAHGTDAIVVCGTTGEASALHDKEHREALAWCCEYVNHRVPVVAGTGSNDTAYAIELTKFAAECGADAGLSVTPYYNKTTQRGLIAHYTAIADCCDLPIVLYNVPSRTGVSFTADTLYELSKHHGEVRRQPERMVRQRRPDRPADVSRRQGCYLGAVQRSTAGCTRHYSAVL